MCNTGASAHTSSLLYIYEGKHLTENLLRRMLHAHLGALEQLLRTSHPDGQAGGRQAEKDWWAECGASEAPEPTPVTHFLGKGNASQCFPNRSTPWRLSIPIHEPVRAILIQTTALLRSVRAEVAAGRLAPVSLRSCSS